MKHKCIGTMMLLSALLLAGCGNKDGSEFIGKWINSKNNKETMDIERNGENFIIHDAHPKMIGFMGTDKIETSNIPATIKNGMLQITGPGGSLSLAYEKASGKLTDGSTEYQKTK